jgi:hypothetical protein
VELVTVVELLTCQEESKLPQQVVSATNLMIDDLQQLVTAPNFYTNY